MQQPADAPLVATISAKGRTFAKGANIHIDVTVQNISHQDLPILKALGPDGQASAANHGEVFNAQGERVASPGLRAGWISRKQTPLEPGQSTTDFLLLNKLFDMNKPGRYTIIFKHELVEPGPSDSKIKRTLIPSNVLEITVSE